MRVEINVEVQFETLHLPVDRLLAAGGMDKASNVSPISRGVLL